MSAMSNSPVPDEVVCCCHQIVVDIDASHIIHNLWRGNLRVRGVETAPITDLQDTQTHKCITLAWFKRSHRRCHLEEETQKCHNTKSYLYTSSSNTHKQTHPTTHTHTQTNTQWMTRSHLLLIGAFTDTRCTRVAPAGCPLVFALTEPFKRDTSSVKWFLCASQHHKASAGLTPEHMVKVGLLIEKKKKLRKEKKTFQALRM